MVKNSCFTDGEVRATPCLNVKAMLGKITKKKCLHIYFERFDIFKCACLLFWRKRLCWLFINNNEIQVGKKKPNLLGTGS